MILLADVGTPLMWASMFYLVIGNLFIGICEGLVLAKVFKRNRLLCVAVMIPANYFSAWIGAFGVAWFTNFKLSPPLNVALWLVIALIFASYLLSIILEWPFIILLFIRQKRWLKMSFIASVVAQSASYAVITPFFFLASYLSLLTRTHVDSHYGQWSDPNAMLYYIDYSDHKPYCSHLDGSNRLRISEQTFPSDQDRLFVRLSYEDEWDLYGVRFKNPNDQNGEIVLLKAACAKTAAIPNSERYGNGGIQNWFNFGEAADLRSEDDREWTVNCGFWPFEGLNLHNEKTKENRHFALETPFLAWPIRDAAVIPGDQVIFQMGQDQIAILDIKTSRIGAIVRGTGPVVAYP